MSPAAGPGQPSPAGRPAGLKHWGWGAADRQPSAAELGQLAVAVRERLGFGGEPEHPVPLERVELRAPRLEPPPSPEGLFDAGRHERARHALGSSYRDVVRGFRGEFENPPDLVAFPADEDGIERVLEHCAGAGAAVIPFGGGTSVVGGVEPRLSDPDRPVVSLDLSRLDRVLEIDEASLAARIQAGATGPGLEGQLRRRGLTLRHFPQSFEFSTLGGWVATRAGGHFATGETHIDDLVESVRAVTPAGLWQSRRLPGSGAGPSPDRMLLGSEGILGVVTEAWARVRPRPTHRASATVAFGDFVEAATGAVREIAQSRLGPSNCRLIDPVEAEMMGAGDGTAALLLLGFESAGVPVDGLLEQALGIATGHGGRILERRAGPGDGGGSGGSGDSWRSAFMQAPYLRDSLVACGVLTETFESAITWDRFRSFHAEVVEATRTAVAEASAPASGGREAAGELGARARISCRLTHVYPDGAAPYFTVVAPAVRGGEVEQWDRIKAAASEAVIAAGGTVTHHHAVGRDHRPGYDRQRPDAFAAALRAAKSRLDPDGMLNPGVLIDP